MHVDVPLSMMIVESDGTTDQLTFDVFVQAVGQVKPSVPLAVVVGVGAGVAAWR